MNDDRARSGPPEERLDALLAAYRDACPDPEPSADFMPGLWRKIEAQRAFAFTWRRLAQGIVTAAALVRVMMRLVLLASRHTRRWLDSLSRPASTA